MAKRARRGQHAAASSRSESAEQPATSVPSEPAAKRPRTVEHAAASSRSESAEQPATSVPSEPAAKRPRTVEHAAASSRSESAEQPATSLPSEPAAKRARTVQHAIASIAFITCAPSSQDFSTNRDLRALLKAVHNVLEAGATIVNIAFATSTARDLVNANAILPELRKVFDATWTGSVGQPAYAVRNIGSVMSFLSCSGATLLSERILDPEAGLPALMLTFSAPEGRLCMIISSVPDLPMRARARILNCYVDAAADTQAKNIVIAGRWQGSLLSMENIVIKQKMSFDFFTNERLCLLAHAPDCAPVRCFPLDTGGPYSFMGVWESFRSVEQPAPLQARLKPARQAVVLRPFTPLYDNLIANLELAVQGHRSGQGFIDYITDCCFFGKLLTMDVYGDPIETPVPLSVKMETLLQAARRQREKQQQRLKRRGVQYAYVPLEEMHMDPADDMKEIFNTWRQDVDSWMKPSTLTTYRDLQQNGLSQAAHQLAKKTFSTYQFQLSGCKFLLHKLIQLPLIRSSPAGTVRSVEQPLAILSQLLYAYEEHKQTEQYQKAIRRNKEHQVAQLRLSQQIWWAQYNYSQGRKLSDMVKDNTCKFDDLTAKDQQLVEDFDTRRSAKTLDELLRQRAFKQQPYRGPGTETTTTPCLM